MKIQAGLVLSQRYRLLSRIAVGGMGEVWRARDKDSGLLVAIKILRDELAGQKHFLDRIRVEAENTKKIIHPNLAQVLHYGETDGYGWIVMELVEGEPLSKILENGQTISAKRLLPILIQTANALEAVHSAGVIHRDIKPANILITENGVVKITDFGISKSETQPNMTAVGMVMGTAQYLSPEQTLGKPASELSDIYALGIIAFEALVGNRPYTGKTQYDIAFAHVSDPTPELPPYVQPALAQVIQSMIAKEPADRPQTAKQLSQQLYKVMLQVCPDASVPVASFAKLDRPMTRRDTQSVPKISIDKEQAKKQVENFNVSRETFRYSTTRRLEKRADTQNLSRHQLRQQSQDSTVKKYLAVVMLVLLAVVFVVVFTLAFREVANSAPLEVLSYGIYSNNDDMIFRGICNECNFLAQTGLSFTQLYTFDGVLW